MTCADLSCPLSSVVLRECGPIVTTPLVVDSDREWTLKEGVQLVPRVCCSPRGFLVWRTDDSREVLRVSCETARRVVGPSGFVPAGTSLLQLIASM